MNKKYLVTNGCSFTEGHSLGNEGAWPKFLGEKMTWKQIMKDENPEKIPLPAIFAEKLSAFQHLMLIKVLRKTKLIYSIK